MPDFVVGLHIATGSGRTLWIEKATKPVLNRDFAAKIGADLIRDDDDLQRGRGQLRHVRDHRGGGGGDDADLPARLSGDRRHRPRRPEGEAQRRSATPIRRTSTTTSSSSIPTVASRWRWRRARRGCPTRPGSRRRSRAGSSATRTATRPASTSCASAGVLRLLPPRITTGLQFKQYRKLALLNGVRGTPGQLYTSSIYYLEGYTESAFGVSVERCAGDDRHLLERGARAAAAVDQPGPARPPLTSDVGLHPARAEDGGLRVRPDQGRRLPRVRTTDGRGAARRPGFATRCTGRRTRGSTRDKLDYMYGAAEDRELEGGAAGRLRR